MNSTGLFVVFLASFLFCFQNVIVRVLFTEQNILGLWEVGGYVAPTLADSLILLLLRMICVVPVMALMANRLYGSTWSELKNLRKPGQRTVVVQALGGGFLMFLYLVLLYIAISLIPTGIAITLFFTYPIFTALLAWKLFGDIPSALRWLVIALTLLGTLFTVPYSDDAISSSFWWGLALAIASGIAYAFYTVLAQQTFAQLHPVPFTWLSFATTLVLSVIALSIWHPVTGQLPWLEIWICSILSAFFTFTGHVLNNWGIHLIGASRATIIGATNPALTAVLAALVIQENLNNLQFTGIAIVTVSIALLNYDKTRQAE